MVLISEIPDSQIFNDVDPVDDKTQKYDNLKKPDLLKMCVSRQIEFKGDKREDELRELLMDFDANERRGT